MIQAQQISKSYGRRKVLQGLDLSVEPGEIVALIGLNGAGKTTLIRALATLVKPDSGKIEIDMMVPTRDPGPIRARLGVVLHASMLYANLTCRENLQFYARMYDLAHSTDRVERLLSQMDLRTRADDRVVTFSRGMQQRLSVARALLHDPKYLLMDEVFTGLDQRFISSLPDLMRQQASEGKGILFTTHELERVFSVATRVDVLHRGRILFSHPVESITPAQLLDQYQAITFDLAVTLDGSRGLA